MPLAADTFQASILFSCAVLAGALNGVAGGGSFISFPALIFTGVSPIAANATNNAALILGNVGSVSVYRRELTNQRQEAFILGAISILGGILGGVLLLHTSQPVFTKLIPYLLFAASLIFTFSKSLVKRLRAYSEKFSKNSYYSRGIVLLVQLTFATYGGFFGGGVGILLLATLSLISENVFRQLAYKNLMVTVINFAAMFPFILAGVVAWHQAGLMAIGALIGGYLSAKFAYKIEPELVRRFVIFVGFSMSFYFFIC